MGVSCYPVCPIKPNINITERPNPTFQPPLCSLEAPAQLHTKPRHGQAGHGHYTTHGLAGLFRSRDCLLHIPLVPVPRQEGPGRKPSSHRGSGCGQPGQLQVIGVSFRRRLCPAELKYNSVATNHRSTPFGFPGSSHSFAFTLRVWFYYADLSANRLQIVLSIQNAEQPGAAARHWRPKRASPICTSCTRADAEAADFCGENTARFAMRSSKS